MVPWLRVGAPVFCFATLSNSFDLHTSFFHVCKTTKDDNCPPHENIVIPNFWLTLVETPCHFTEWEGTLGNLKIRIATQLPSPYCLSLLEHHTISFNTWASSLLHSTVFWFGFFFFARRIILHKTEDIFIFTHCMYVSVYTAWEMVSFKRLLKRFSNKSVCYSYLN